MVLLVPSARNLESRAFHRAILQARLLQVHAIGVFRFFVFSLTLSGLLCVLVTTQDRGLASSLQQGVSLASSLRFPSNNERFRIIIRSARYYATGIMLLG